MATKKQAEKKRRPKGEGSYYQRPNGSWSYTIKLPSGKSRTVSAKTQKLCVEKAKELRKQVDAGLNEDPNLTFAKWSMYWLDEICPTRVRDSTIDGYRGYMRRYLRPALGRHPLRAIAPEHVRAIYKAMAADGKSTATIRQTHAILSRCLKVACDEGKIVRNPCDSVDPPKPTESKTHGTVTIAETAAIMATLTDTRKRARWLTALLGGLRAGEALGLDWADVDLEAREIRVRQAQYVHEGVLGIGPVKSKRSNRVVPMMDPLWDALVAWKELSGGVGLVFGPRDNKADWEEWQVILKHTKIDGKSLPPRPRHACRSATASILTAANVPPRVVADILGHANPVVTETHYIVTGMETRRAGMMDGMKLLEESAKQLEKKDAS